MRTLAGLVLIMVAITGRAEGEPDRGTIGLLPLPEVFGHYPCEQFAAQEVLVYPAPATSTPNARIVVTQPWTLMPEGGCQGLRVKLVDVDGMERGDPEQPGSKPSITLAGSGPWPVDVIDRAAFAGEWWVQVKLLAIEPCTDQPTGLEPISAWVRFQGEDGRAAVWFHSRGC